jgi:hypothetical protein
VEARLDGGVRGRLFLFGHVRMVSSHPS